MLRLMAQIFILLLLLPSISFGSEGKISIPLIVHEALREGVSGVDRRSEPVAVGIPFPKGILKEKNGVLQLALEGTEDFQFRTLARWPDGSVRWALVDFQADVKAEKMNQGIKIISGNGNSSGKIAIDKGGIIFIDTGAMTVQVKKKGFNLFNSVIVSGKEIVSGYSNGIIVIDGEGRECLASNDKDVRVTVEENGPVRAVIKAEGTHVRDNKTGMDYTVRMHFYKNKSRVKVVYTLRNASKKQFKHTYIRSIGLVTNLSLPGPYKVDIAKHDGVTQERLLDKNDDLAYYQAVSDFPQRYTGNSFYYHAPIPPDYKREKQRGFVQEGYWIKKNKQDLASGKRSEYPDLAFLDISDENGKGVTVGIRFAAGWWPKSLRASGDGRVEVGLWPEENEVGYWIRYGSHNTFEIMYNFHVEHNAPADSMKRFQYPLIARAPVDWYNRNVNGIYPLYNFVSFADEKDYVKGKGWDYSVGWRKPKVKIWRYHYWGHGGFLNQHDFARISLVNFLRETQDPGKAGEYFLYSEARFNYNADWAVYHSDDYICTRCTKRGYGPQENKKKANLAKVIFEIEHIHWYGLPLYYYVTGDERIKEAILDWGEIVKEWSKKPWIIVYQRFFGWEMYSLAAMYDFTGDPSFMKMADKLFLCLINAKLDINKPSRTAFIDWERGYIAGGSGSGWGKDPGLKPGLMTGYIIFDGLYNYYLQMDEEHPLKEKVADVLEGVSEFMYREPYCEGQKKGHWAFWLPYVYNLVDRTKSAHQYRLILQAFYVNLAPYLANGEDRCLERMDKIIRMTAWDQAGVWGSFGHIDYPGLQSILYQRVPPKNDTTPPPPVEDQSAKVKGNEVVLSWTVPADAVRYQIKYSPKKLVESLEFDPDTRTYKYEPSEHANWWAGENISNEPKPIVPGTKQSCIIKGLKPGHYYFAIRSWDSSNNRSRISNLAEVEIRN